VGSKSQRDASISHIEFEQDIKVLPKNLGSSLRERLHHLQRGALRHSTSGSSKHLFSAANFQAFDSLFTIPPSLSVNQSSLAGWAFVSKASKYY
jgi:hypothetical protein